MVTYGRIDDTDDADDTCEDMDDPLALPAGAQDRVRRLEEARAQRIAALHAAAQARHDARCRAARTRLMDGQDDLATYRAAMAESAATLAAEQADAPPVIDTETMAERVHIRAAEAAAGWWADEVAQAARTQDAWTPRESEEGTDHGA